MITKEQLIEVFNRGEEVYLIKHKYKPDGIEILSDGTLQGYHEVSFGSGEYETEFNEIELEELYDILDNIRKIRLEKELQEKIRQDKLEEERKIFAIKQAKNKRREEYLKLKEEFGNE